MYLADNINSFSANITKEQLAVITDFFTNPVNWDEVKHGDKQKLGENISVVFLAASGSNEWLNVLEAHQKFYDLHCTIEGSDVIVSKPVTDCTNTRTAYNEEADYALYNETPAESVAVPANNYCLIPPADAHMALYGECGFVKKLVFKIPVSA